MTRVVHFEISANDPDRVVAFYKEVFGWQITKWSGPRDYWTVTTGEAGTTGINGGIFRPSEQFSGTVNTIDVPSLAEYSEKVKTNGGTVVTETTTIPGVGYLAYCKYVEGTLFGITQADPMAGKL